jgi:hypothetical protein
MLVGTSFIYMIALEFVVWYVSNKYRHCTPLVTLIDSFQLEIYMLQKKKIIDDFCLLYEISYVYSKN